MTSFQISPSARIHESGHRDLLQVAILSTNVVLSAVLADELNESTFVVAASIDIAWLENERYVPSGSEIVLVTEAAVGRWLRWRERSGSNWSGRVFIGAIGTQWLSLRDPRRHGFDGCLDLRLPSRDLIRNLRRTESVDLPASSETGESVPPWNSQIARVCLDAFDRRILAYLTMGMSDREISGKVHLSPQTVRNRVSRMLDRAHVSNRTQLAMACVKFPKLLEV